MMKKEMERLRKERDTFMEQVTNIDNAIEAFQKVCKHKTDNGINAMKYDGYDSYKKFYKCEICGFTKSC